MRRTWKRMYIPLSPCRLGNYLLILRRTAPMVVSPNLAIFFFFLLDLFFPEKRLLKEFKAVKRNPSRSFGSILFNLKWESGLHCLHRHEHLITEHPAVLLNTLHNVDSIRSIKDPRRQTAWAELSRERFSFCLDNIYNHTSSRHALCLRFREVKLSLGTRVGFYKKKINKKTHQLSSNVI